MIRLLDITSGCVMHLIPFQMKTDTRQNRLINVRLLKNRKESFLPFRSRSRSDILNVEIPHSLRLIKYLKIRKVFICIQQISCFSNQHICSSMEFNLENHKAVTGSWFPKKNPRISILPTSVNIPSLIRTHFLESFRCCKTNVKYK